MTEKTTSSAAAPKQDTGMATVAYILTWLTGLIIFLMAKKEDKFTRFHALQAIFLGAIFFVLYLLLQLVLMPFLSAGAIATFSLVFTILWLLLVVLIIVAAVKAYKGQKWMIPLIGNFAEKYA